MQGHQGSGCPECGRPDPPWALAVTRACDPLRASRCQGEVFRAHEGGGGSSPKILGLLGPWLQHDLWVCHFPPLDSKVSLLWELSGSFQPRKLGSSHLFLKGTFRRASAVAQLEEHVPPPMLRMCGLPGKVLRVGERGPSFCLVGTDPSILPIHVAAAEASGLWLELHRSHSSEVPAFHGRGKGICVWTPAYLCSPGCI